MVKTSEGQIPNLESPPGSAVSLRERLCWEGYQGCEGARLPRVPTVDPEGAAGLPPSRYRQRCDWGEQASKLGFEQEIKFVHRY